MVGDVEVLPDGARVDEAVEAAGFLGWAIFDVARNVLNQEPKHFRYSGKNCAESVKVINNESNYVPDAKGSVE